MISCSHWGMFPYEGGPFLLGLETVCREIGPVSWVYQRLDFGWLG